MQRRVWDLPAAAKGRPGKGMGNTHPQVSLWFCVQSGNSSPVDHAFHRPHQPFRHLNSLCSKKRHMNFINAPQYVIIFNHFLKLPIE